MQLVKSVYRQFNCQIQYCVLSEYYTIYLCIYKLQFQYFNFFFNRSYSNRVFVGLANGKVNVYTRIKGTL